MSNIIERLRSSKNGVEHVAANEIEQLQAKNAELTAEVERWKTISVCEACAELPAVFQYIEGMEKQLAIARTQRDLAVSAIEAALKENRIVPMFKTLAAIKESEEN